MAAEISKLETNISPRIYSGIKTLSLFAAVTVWALWTGYYMIFSVFAWYDDEGYLMITIRQFLNGNVLYDEVYTQYGPAYYIYKWLQHTLLYLPITHDVTRLTTLVMWVLIALTAGLFTFRLSRSALGGATAYAVTFLALFRTAYGPAHPQEIYGLLIVVSLFLLPNDNKERNFDVRLILLGAALAFVCLTKINIGVFLCLAIAITFVAFTAANWLQRCTLIVLMTGAVLLPFVLFRNHLSMRWLELGILVAVSLITSLLVSLAKNNRAVFSIRHYATTTIAFLVTFFLIILFVWLKGTTFAALLDGIVFNSLRFGNDFILPATIYRFAVGWALVALFAAAGILFYKKRKPFETKIAVALFKTGFGLAVILVSVVGYHEISVTVLERVVGPSFILDWLRGAGVAGNFLLLNFATPILWLLILEQIEKRNFSSHVVSRTALVLAAILQTLMIYPIPGSQLAYATFLMVPIAVLCLCDAFSQLKVVFPQSFGKSQFKAYLVVVSAFALFIAGTYQTHISRKIYNRQFALNLPGATLARLPENEIAVYKFLTENFKLNCDTFLTMPGFNSFYFWTEREPPTNLNATAWMTLFGDSQQRSVVEQLKTSGRVCAAYHPGWTNVWLREQNLESFPLAAYILKNFTTIGEVKEYQFMRQNGSIEDLVYAARIPVGEQNSIEFILPPKFDFEIHRIELFDVGQQHAITDSQASQPTVLNRQNERVNFPFTPIDDSSISKKYKLRWSFENQANLLKPENLVLRLYGKAGNLIASLPFPIN